MKNGLIQVYTGDGKGKTTAAFGMAFRAHGRGFKVAVVQFMKSWVTGELILAEKLEDFDVMRIDTIPKFTWELNEHELADLKSTIRAGFSKACALVLDGNYDMVIMDEFNHILAQGFVTKNEVMAFFDAKPDTVELVLTGRNAPDWLMERADLVTEMKCIKHPYEKGIPARVSIEK